MADGAIMSAPASVATTDWRARFSMVMSFATWSCSITPQWPWSVYSQKQMSGITTRSRRRALRPPHHARHQAVVVPGVAADGILVVRDAEQHQRLHPVPRQPLHHVFQLALGDARNPRHLGDRQRIVDGLLDEQRLDQVIRGDLGLPHQGAKGVGLPQPAQAGGGKGRGHGASGGDR